MFTESGFKGARKLSPYGVGGCQGSTKVFSTIKKARSISTWFAYPSSLSRGACPIIILMNDSAYILFGINAARVNCLNRCLPPCLPFLTWCKLNGICMGLFFKIYAIPARVSAVSVFFNRLEPLRLIFGSKYCDALLYPK